MQATLLGYNVWPPLGRALIVSSRSNGSTRLDVDTLVLEQWMYSEDLVFDVLSGSVQVLSGNRLAVS